VRERFVLTRLLADDLQPYASLLGTPPHPKKRPRRRDYRASHATRSAGSESISPPPEP
jgi:hypothetical protein